MESLRADFQDGFRMDILKSLIVQHIRSVDLFNSGNLSVLKSVGRDASGNGLLKLYESCESLY